MLQPEDRQSSPEDESLLLSLELLLESSDDESSEDEEEDELSEESSDDESSEDDELATGFFLRFLPPFACFPAASSGSLSRCSGSSSPGAKNLGLYCSTCAYAQDSTHLSHAVLRDARQAAFCSAAADIK